MSGIPPTILQAALLGRYGHLVRQYEAPTRYHYPDERREVEVSEGESRYQEEVAERVRAAVYVPPKRLVISVVGRGSK